MQFSMYDFNVYTLKVEQTENLYLVKSLHLQVKNDFRYPKPCKFHQLRPRNVGLRMRPFVATEISLERR